MSDGYTPERVHAALEVFAELTNEQVDRVMSKEASVKLSSVWQEEHSPEQVREIEAEVESELEAILSEEYLYVMWREDEVSQFYETVVWRDQVPPTCIVYEPDHIEIWRCLDYKGNMRRSSTFSWETPSLYEKVLGAVFD